MRRDGQRDGRTDRHRHRPAAASSSARPSALSHGGADGPAPGAASSSSSCCWCWWRRRRWVLAPGRAALSRPLPATKRREPSAPPPAPPGEGKGRAGQDRTGGGGGRFLGEKAAPGGEGTALRKASWELTALSARRIPPPKRSATRLSSKSSIHSYPPVSARSCLYILYTRQNINTHCVRLLQNMDVKACSSPAFTTKTHSLCL